MHKRKVLSKTSIFPAGPEEIWARLQLLRTLQHIASPFASFTPLDGQADLVWREGQRFEFRFRLFCLLPLGTHTIDVVRFSAGDYEVYTRESNPHVPVWNHSIRLRAVDERGTQYTDEVEICAGWKTPFVYAWARLFYAHRQKKWIRLLRAPG